MIWKHQHHMAWQRQASLHRLNDDRWAVSRTLTHCLSFRLWTHEVKVHTITLPLCIKQYCLKLRILYTPVANLALIILGFLVLVFWSAPLFSAAMVQFAPSFFLKLQVTCYSLQLQQAPNHSLPVLVQCRKTTSSEWRSNWKKKKEKKKKPKSRPRSKYSFPKIQNVGIHNLGFWNLSLAMLGI